MSVGNIETSALNESKPEAPIQPEALSKEALAD
jgi:hypothetical protein